MCVLEAFNCYCSFSRLPNLVEFFQSAMLPLDKLPISLSPENVMREATPTPSEVCVPSPRAVQRMARKDPRSAAMATGSTSTASREPSSETEMVNYSSGVEDDPGMDDLSGVKNDLIQRIVLPFLYEIVWI